MKSCIEVSRRKALDFLKIIRGTVWRTSGRSRNCFWKKFKLQGKIGSFWCKRRRTLEKDVLKAR